MAVQLAERQFGFDPLELGFPSIENCMAIVYVTGNGLYGFHNLGGNGDLLRWTDKSFAFLNCMNKINARDVTKGTRLYGVTHFENRGHVPEELATFAFTLGFKGTIEGRKLKAEKGRKKGHRELFLSNERMQLTGPALSHSVTRCPNSRPGN